MSAIIKSEIGRWASNIMSQGGAVPEESPSAIKTEDDSDESNMGEGPTDESDSAAEDEAGMDVAMEDVHWDSSSTANTTSEEQPSDNENIAPSGDNRVLTEEMMGEAIAAAFELDLGYDEEKRHMFDDGLSGDDSLTHESDTSDIEEDEEQEPSSLSLKRIVREGSVQYTEESSFEYDTSDDDDESMDVGVGFPVLDVLQKSDIKLQLQGRIRDEKTLKVFELEESRLQIQEEIRVAQAEAKDCESLIRKAYRAMLIRLDNTVLSRELFAGYKMFCEFLQPEYGSREGFSITCAEPHTGSYVLYDPAFHLFKEHVELDYMVCNWRCEASVVNPPNGAAEYVVEFWPLQTPENLEADKQTWGRLFPKLYHMLKDASYKGSSAAKEILRRIPDGRASFTGGWLFDYQFEELLAEEPVVSNRWTLRGSHSLINLDGDE